MVMAFFRGSLALVLHLLTMRLALLNLPVGCLLAALLSYLARR